MIEVDFFKNVPEINGQDGKGGNAFVYGRLFTPDSNWSWYILEMDENKDLCFGVIEGLEAEYGYFSINEINQVRGPLGLEPEIDLFFTPRKLKEVYIEGLNLE